MTPSRLDEIVPVVRRFIEGAGHASQSLGVGRVAGQVYAYLYFSQGPRSLADLQAALGISKGSASMSVRQLEQWGAARKIWVPGDRKDYYEANDWFGRIIKSVLLDMVAGRMASFAEFLDAAEAELPSNGTETAHYRERIAHMRSFQRKAQKVWNTPLLRQLLK